MTTSTVNTEITGFDALSETNARLLSRFIDGEYYGAMSRKLAIELISQMEADSFISSYNDIVSHGADTGMNGFISTYELNEFFKANKVAIVSFAKTFSEDFGYDSMADMIKHFKMVRCHDYSTNQIIIALLCEPELEVDDEDGDADTIRSAVVWFALEQLCYQMQDFE